AQSEVATGNELAKNWGDAHGRGLVLLPFTHGQVAGVDAPALLEKVAHGQRSLVVDDALRLIDERIAKLRNQGLDRNLIDRAAGGDIGDDVAEGDNLSQLGLTARQAVVQTPEQVNRVSHEGRGIVDGDRAPADHANGGIVEGRAEMLEGMLCGQNVRAQENKQGATCLLEEEIDC